MEIEEIAEQHSMKDLGKTSPAYELGFTQGANYQHKVDIEKAECICKKWLEEIIICWLPDLKDEPFHSQAVQMMVGKLHKAMEK